MAAKRIRPDDVEFFILLSAFPDRIPAIAGKVLRARSQAAPPSYRDASPFFQVRSGSADVLRREGLSVLRCEMTRRRLFPERCSLPRRSLFPSGKRLREAALLPSRDRCRRE